MIRNNLYYLTELNNEIMLIPTGQAAVDGKPGLSLNETGRFIWEKLDTDLTTEQLIHEMLKAFTPEREDVSALTNDTVEFLEVLSAKGLLFGFSGSASEPSAHNFITEIAGIKIALPSDDDFIHKSLYDFKSEEAGHIDINIHIRIGNPPDTQTGRCIVRNTELLILENDGEYVIVYLKATHLKEVRINHNLSEATVYAAGPMGSAFKDEVLSAIRTPFLLTALDRGMVMLHSASVLYNNKLLCFSAPAGTGKSTHSALWEDCFNTRAINGDLNLLVPRDGKVYIPATPWCGTSGRYDTREYELGKIIFLQRGKKNEVHSLVPGNAVRKLLARVISPMWDSDKARKVTEVVGKIPTVTYNLLLSCTPEKEAAIILKKYLDSEKAL